MSSNIPILATLQGERYINPNATSPPNTANSQRQPRLTVPVPIIAGPEDILISKYEYILHKLRALRLANYNQAVYIPPMAKPGLQTADDTLLPLMDKVEDFLEGNGQVMLILGDSGAGKSTFNRYLENELWQTYIKGDRIPLLVNLPTLDRPDKDLMFEQLKRLNFSSHAILELRQCRQFVVMCDGYDECQLTANLHTVNCFNQAGQWNVKMIITCRTQYLGPDYRNRFVPMEEHQYRRAANDLFQEAVIVPFSKGQIEDYVEQYVLFDSRTWTKEEYMHTLTEIPNLMDLVRNPFLLTLYLKALPSVIQGSSDLSRLRVTRIQLYDIFVNNWLEANKHRLQDQRLSAESMMTFDELKEEGFEFNVTKFQQDLAAAIFTRQDGRPIVDYVHRRDKFSWKAMFFCQSPEATILRGASLLNRSGTRHYFVHQSILEYFYSCTICPPSSTAEEFAPQECFDFATALASIDDHPLSQRNLVVEPSIVRLLSERVKSQPAFKEHLLAIIEMSKTDKQASQASANAITILIRSETSFNGTDLQGIRIPGADLSGGQFDSAHFQGADLTGVNFTKSWIRQANFSVSLQ
ncbi:hypothetical protein BGZ96_011451 [Linnemannia gamsii]|uniref:NACHT domain-containing protein n=1 Tax=Linnemannia gamsii TaxID=64522 RepID=A0ABQ7JTW8_9FUNG|nr:hypothetical protein BGZ96_011451 [Linnemannia gamsii]